ncbi:HvfC family RiPP maturation protein [Echinimonas agarilytica]|uniref:DNA-binding domain-containing protein n=1 Tax=Echinimonas agarilytica TaxID=1215918 RepID=A0AA41W6W7_9GAMM|nr:putative DNA-binding domain-containing protein [Echinimonas agarilytica]MCM2679832.1 putative DNA-binding domain-containing protein [Echinimonas agarilytica]
MSQILSFQAHQHLFAEHLRNPESRPVPEGVEDRRMGIYRDLFFNNVKGFIDQAFPVLHSIMGEEAWLHEVKGFWAAHSSHSPYFIDISKEFLDYLISEREAKPTDPAFMIELAHYEWIELSVSVKHCVTLDKPIEAEQLVENTCLRVSDTAIALQYQFPVHQLKVDFQPEQPTEHGVYLVVYRDFEDDIQFLEINAVTAKLLELILASPGINLTQLQQPMCDFMPAYPAEQVASGALQVLQQLALRGIVRARVQP